MTFIRNKDLTCIACLEKTSAEEYEGFEEVTLDHESDSEDYSLSNKTPKALLDQLSDRALEAANRSDKVVVRHSADISCQDSLVNRLIAGGANHENITVVRLAMDHGTKTDANGSCYSTKYCTWRPKTLLA